MFGFDTFADMAVIVNNLAVFEKIVFEKIGIFSVDNPA